MEVLSANAERRILPERVKKVSERALVAAAAILALSAQSLPEEASSTDLIKNQFGITDLTDVKEVHEIPDWYGCPSDENSERLPGWHVNTYTTQGDISSYDTRSLVEIGGPNGVVKYEEDGVTVYCGESIGVSDGHGPTHNPPAGTVLVAPEFSDMLLVDFSSDYAPEATER